MVGSGMPASMKGGSVFGSITMILIGIGMIVFASTCFKDLPLIGTVFLMPGENIMKAKMAEPVLRYALFLIGGAFTAFGTFLQFKIGYDHLLEENSQNAAFDKQANSRGINLNGVKEAKELLDAGTLTDDEFNRIKEKLL